MKGVGLMYQKMKAYVVGILLQALLAGMYVIAKVALNKGMSNFVFIVYKHAIAEFIVYKHAIATSVIAPFAWAFERPVVSQNLYFMGMKYTTATFVAALSNAVSGVAFVMACLFKYSPFTVLWTTDEL